MLVFFTITVSPSFIPASIIESPETFRPKCCPFLLSSSGIAILLTSFCIASIGVPAAILPNTGILFRFFLSFWESKPPLITLGEKVL